MKTGKWLNVKCKRLGNCGCWVKRRLWCWGHIEEGLLRKRQESRSLLSKRNIANMGRGLSAIVGKVLADLLIPSFTWEHTDLWLWLHCGRQWRQTHKEGGLYLWQGVYGYGTLDLGIREVLSEAMSMDMRSLFSMWRGRRTLSWMQVPAEA